MPPLTTITILVYDLVKVNPTTRALPVLRIRKGSPACLQKKSDKRLTKKIAPTTEQRKPAWPASRTQHCQTVLQNGNVNRPDQAQCQQAIQCQKEGNLQRLWISHLISTGWLVSKHEVMRRPAFYTILLLAWYSDYARFILRVNGWSCWKKATYPQKNPRLLLLLFLYINLL